MRRLILSLAALLAALSPIFAGEPYRVFAPTSFEVGMEIRAGANVSSMICVPVGESQFRMNAMAGFNAGAAVNFHLLEGLYIESGLNITSRGGKATYLEGTIYNRYFPVYLELPLMASFRIVCLDDLQIFLNAGGYGALGGYGRIRTNSGAVYDFFGDGSDSLAGRWDAGLLAGFSATIYDRLSIGFRYTYGLMNIANAYTRKDIGSFYSNAMSFYVGYVLF